MPSTPTRSVAPTPEIESRLGARAASGRFGGAIRDGLGSTTRRGEARPPRADAVGAG